VKQAKDDTRKELGVDENGDPIPTTDELIEADTLQNETDTTSGCGFSRQPRYKTC